MKSLLLWEAFLREQFLRYDRILRGHGATVGGLLVTFALCATLNRAVPDPPLLGHDGANLVAMARDCLEFGRCHAVGPLASLPLYTGTTWVHFLMAMRLLGEDSLETRAAVYFLISLATVTLGLLFWRWLGASVALLAFTILALLLSDSRNPWMLWNPSASFFPNALAFGALLVGAWTGRFWPLLVAAADIAVSLNMHLSALVLLVPLAGVASLTGRHPVPRTFMVLLSCVAISFVVAPGSTVRNLQMFWANVPIGLSVPAACAAAIVWRLRRSFQAAGRRTQAVVVSLLAEIPWVVGDAWKTGTVTLGSTTIVRWVGGSESDSYRPPVLAPIALLITLVVLAGVEVLTRWRQQSHQSESQLFGSGFCILMLLGTAHSHESPPWPGWSHEEARLVSEDLQERGWTYERLLNELQHPRCSDIVAGFAAYGGLSHDDAHPPLRTARLWRVTKAEAPPARPGLHLIPLPHDRVAVITEFDSWLRIHDLEYCLPEEGGSGACVTPLHRPVLFSASEPLFADRAGHWYPPQERIAARTEQVRVPLSSDEAVREITVFSPPRCAWRIASVEGLPWERTENPAGVRITGRAQGHGTLVLERTPSECPEWKPDPPCFGESLPSDPPELRSADIGGG